MKWYNTCERLCLSIIKTETIQTNATFRKKQNNLLLMLKNCVFQLGNYWKTNNDKMLCLFDHVTIENVLEKNIKICLLF